MATATEVVPWLARKGVTATAEGRTTIHAGEYTVELPSNYKGIRPSDLANFVVKRLAALQEGSLAPETAAAPAPEPEVVEDPTPAPEEPSETASSTEDSPEEDGEDEGEAEGEEVSLPEGGPVLLDRDGLIAQNALAGLKDLESMTHKELNVLLEQAGLSTSGSKADKVERLQG